MDDIEKRVNQQFLGVLKLNDQQKKELFEIAYVYMFLKNWFENVQKIKFSEKHMPDVLGMLIFRNDYVDAGCFMAKLVLDDGKEGYGENWESVDWSKLTKISGEMNKLFQGIGQINNIGWFEKMIIWLKYGDWAQRLLKVAIYFVVGFISLSILYFLVATELGRNLAWRFLDVYGVLIRIVLYCLLALALLLIIGFVSFFYLENKQKR